MFYCYIFVIKSTQVPFGLGKWKKLTCKYIFKHKINIIALHNRYEIFLLLLLKSVSQSKSIFLGIMRFIITYALYNTFSSQSSLSNFLYSLIFAQFARFELEFSWGTHGSINHMQNAHIICLYNLYRLIMRPSSELVRNCFII